MSVGRYIYNAKDAIATREVFKTLDPLLGDDDEARRIYEAEMGLQGAFLGVQMRGLLVDIAKRDELANEIRGEAYEAAVQAEAFAGESLRGKKGTVSVQKLKAVLYDRLEIRELKDKDDSTTTGEVALQKIIAGKAPCKLSVPHNEKSARKEIAATIARHTLVSREKFKMVQALDSELSPEGRMRFTIVSGGTESYRASSTKSHDGTGVNSQNQDKRLRVIYIPDDGFEMGQRDQRSAESLTVAYCSGDEEYIKAHEAGSPHVMVAKILFPDQDWPDDPKAAKKFANNTWHGANPDRTPGSPQSLYQIAKKTQHGLNYRLTARGLAVQAQLSQEFAGHVYAKYFDRFPRIREWHREVIDEVRRTGRIQYPGGYHRIFFGHLEDEGTWREAISSIPQATIAWTNHIVFSRFYYQLEDSNFQVLAHGHDSVLYQVRIGHRAEYDAKMDELQKVNWPIGDRIMVVPWEVKYGANWQEVS